MSKRCDATDAFWSVQTPNSSYTKSASVHQPRLNIDVYSDYYTVGRGRRGAAIIFNQNKFDDTSLSPRQGSDKDCRDLEDVLTSLSFEVSVYSNLKYGAIYNVLRAAAQADHSKCDCFLVAALTHGDSGRIHARDHQYPPDELWEPFSADKCPTLAGKPKMFLIQACRGAEVDDGVRIETTDSRSSYTIPTMADFLIMHSTYNGYYSWRNPLTGSWFIQSLCEELRENAKKTDVVTILTFVNRRMALSYKSNVPDNMAMHEKKQIGTIVSTLMRLVYLYPVQ